MLWAPGNWEGKLDWSVEKKNYEQSFHFSLSDSDVSSMFAIANYYASGYGVIFEKPRSKLRSGFNSARIQTGQCKSWRLLFEQLGSSARYTSFI